MIDSPGIRAVQYLPGGVVRYCYPLEGNEEVIGDNIFQNPSRKRDARLAVDTKEIALSGPYDLDQGDKRCHTFSLFPLNFKVTSDLNGNVTAISIVD